MDMELQQEKEIFQEKKVEEKIDHLAIAEDLKLIKRAAAILILPIIGKIAVKKPNNLGIKNIALLQHLHKYNSRDVYSYERIYQFIIGTSNTTNDDIAMLVPGDPRMGISIVQDFEEIKHTVLINVNIAPGILVFAALCNDLINHLPRLICSSTVESISIETYESAIGKLQQYLPKIHFGTTLYIPALHPIIVYKPFLDYLRA